MIRSLSLKNFMSYASADIPLSPGVNFICGPNGSGKSTLLIAISLALGMSHTERGRKLSDLIRWGADRSRISLVLDNSHHDGARAFPEFDTDELVVERTLTKSGSYPIKIDGVPATKEELMTLIKSQGINPDNMMIIMQQDMVEEFSLLSPMDKLSMLEEVIEFESYRRDLLQAREDLEALLGEERETRRILDGSNRRVTEWERLYERFQRKRKLEDELEELTAEALWARAAEGEKALQQLESRRGEREQELAHINDRLSELERRIQERSKQLEDSWSELESKKSSLMETVADRASFRAKAEVIGGTLAEAREELGALRLSADRDRAQVEEAVGKLDGLESGEEVARLESAISLAREGISRLARGDRLAELASGIASRTGEATALERHISELRDRIDNPFGRTLAEAGKEVGSMEDLKGEAYGPLYSTMESDDFDLNGLRILLGEELLCSFVTTTEEDRQRVVRFLKERAIDSRVYLVPTSALVLIEKKFLPEEEEVLDWAVDRIRAPGPVKALLHRIAGGVLLVAGGNLRQLASTLQTPVITKEGENAGMLQGLISQTGPGSGNSRGRLERDLVDTTGRYAAVKEELAQRIREMEQARMNRQRELGSLLERILSLSAQLELLRAENVPSEVVMRREADRIRNAFGALFEYKEKRISEIERRIQRMERDLAEQEKAGSSAEAMVSKSEMGYQRGRERLERYLKAYYDLEGRKLVLVDQTRSLKAVIRDIDHRISERREDVEAQRRNAEELSPRISSPRDLLDIEREINTIRGSLSELTDVPDDIEGVYKVYLSDFQNLKRSLEIIIEKREEMQAELRKGLQRWRGIMEGHLESIDEDFNSILSEIGGRGEVHLVNEDVRSVGLDIRVGFEGKEMTSISTLSQSGGEKSLSTMAFLLALQRQIKSPFRAVDEYDVHLDPRNRDRVTQLLKLAVRDGSKQYIAITPSQISKRDLAEAENVIVVQSVDGRSRVGSLVLEAPS
jgi:chromosome segregation ATPase